MEIKLFEFQDKEIRTTAKGRDVWFSGQDVFKVLGLTWKGASGLSARNIPAEWIFSEDSQTLGGKQRMTFIAEQAVYMLAFSSQKTEQSLNFTKWVSGLLVDIRKGRAKLLTPKSILMAMFAAIKEHNTTNCKVHTGMTPQEVKEVGKKMGLKSVARTSAKEVIRNLKPEIAASMSMADRLAGEKGIESGKAAKICKEFALPLFTQLQNLLK